MKKAVLIALSLLLCIALIACSGGAKSDLVGTWVIAVATDENGAEITDEESLATLALIKYDLQKDGKMIMTMDDVQVEGTWSQDGNNITFSAGGVIDTVATLQDGQIVFDMGGGTTILKKS